MGPCYPGTLMGLRSNPVGGAEVRPRSFGAPSAPSRPGGSGTPSPPALTLGAREPERHRKFGAPAKATPRALIRRGRGGSAPTEKTSEGGWVGQSGAQRTLLRDGGVGGAAPHRRHALALGASLRPRRLLAREAAERPHPPALTLGAREPERHREFGAPTKVTPRALIRRGRGGSAPTERTSEGGWVGPEPRAAQARPGWGVGAQPPQRRERPLPRARESCQASRRLAQSTMRSAVGAACSRGRKWPAG